VKCMEPGCAEKADLYLQGREAGEYLCLRHAQEAVNHAQAVVETENELKEHLGSGGRLN
jgi:hypothetical protein